MKFATLAGVFLAATLYTHSPAAVAGAAATHGPVAAGNSTCKGNPSSPYKILPDIDSYCQKLCPGSLCTTTLCSCPSSSSSSSSPPPTSQGPTTSGPKPLIPKGPVVISYFDIAAGTPSFEDVPLYNNIVLLAFSTLDKGIPSDPIAKSPGLADSIKKRQEKGGLVFLSVGGAANCGSDTGVGDSMFGPAAAGNEDAFASGIAELVKKYGLDGVDVDYECIDVGADGKKRQNDKVAAAYMKALRAALPKTTISWTGFSDINTEQISFADHLTTFKAILPYTDIVLWMAYNVGGDRSFYTGIQSQFDKIMTVNPSLTPDRIAIGTCAGKGCAYAPETGPLRSDAATYISAASKTLGLMIWDIRNDYTAAGNDWDKTIAAQAGKAFGSSR